MLCLHLRLDLQLLLFHSYPSHVSSGMRITLYFHAHRLLASSSFLSSLLLFFIMIKMRTSNGSRDDKTYQWYCFNLMLAWKLLWKTDSSGPRVWQRNHNFSNWLSFISNWIERCASTRRSEQWTDFPKNVDKNTKYLMP